MGICCSKGKKSPASLSTPGEFQASSHAPDSVALLEGNPGKNPPFPSPPSPLHEEETVKEVLSETQKPSSPKIEPELSVPENREGGGGRRERVENVEKMEENITTFLSGDEASEVSELCSQSETISTTATISERKGEEEENVSPAKFQRNPPFSREFRGKRDRGGKSPARRYDRSPMGRQPVREQGQANRSRARAGNGGFRRDAYENSGRRSRSPANRNNVGRSPSVRKTSLTNRCKPVEAEEEVVRRTEEVVRRTEERDEGAAVPSSSKETLENPLVALECFIFL